MKVTEEKMVTVTIDVLCDVCSSSTTPPGGSAQYGMLTAHWSYGSKPVSYTHLTLPTTPYV